MLMNFHFWNKVNKEKIRTCQAISNCSSVHKHYKYPQRRCWKPCPCLGSSEKRKSQLRDSKLEDPRDPETIQQTTIQIQCERKHQSMKVFCSLQNAMQVYPNDQFYNGGSKGKYTKKTTTNECLQLINVRSQSILLKASWIQHKQGMRISKEKAAQNNLDVAKGNLL